MENKQAAQHYIRERFKVQLKFVMPCRARKLGSAVEDIQGISVAGRNS